MRRDRLGSWVPGDWTLPQDAQEPASAREPSIEPLKLGLENEIPHVQRPAQVALHGWAPESRRVAMAAGWCRIGPLLSGRRRAWIVFSPGKAVSMGPAWPPTEAIEIGRSC